MELNFLHLSFGADEHLVCCINVSIPVRDKSVWWVIELLLQGEDEEDEEEDELRAKLEAAMIARMKKIKDVNKLENKDKEMKLYASENIKNNKEKGLWRQYSSFE